LKHLELTTVYDAKLIKEQFDWLIEQAEKVERYEKALDDVKNLSTLNEYADADINGLLNACFKTANDVKLYKF
jgi:hypothetical protein